MAAYIFLKRNRVIATLPPIHFRTKALETVEIFSFYEKKTPSSQKMAAVLIIVSFKKELEVEPLR
jgi:hypothetical protein